MFYSKQLCYNNKNSHAVLRKRENDFLNGSQRLVTTKEEKKRGGKVELRTYHTMRPFRSYIVHKSLLHIQRFLNIIVIGSQTQ